MNQGFKPEYKLKAAAQLGDIDLLYTVIQEDPHILEHNDSIPFVETPLHIAAFAGHDCFATEIMRLKPSFAWKLNQEGLSLIHVAMQQGQKEMVLCFVEINKELVRVKGREGLTPLHIASQTGEVNLLANLLWACPESIEDVTIRNETALHIAVRNQQFGALQVLIGWLKRTRQTRAMQLEKTILNWKDKSGNTILHISALLNDIQALQLLLKTKIDLKAKNSEKSTALDTAGSAEVASILLKAGAKRGSSLKDAPTLAEKLKSKITFMDKIIIFILRIRKDITDDQRNAFLIVAALVATATYQSALSPPGGVYQASAGDNSSNTTSLNSTANATQTNAGKSVMNAGDFLTLSIFNTQSLLVSIIIIYILTPSGIVGSILYSPMFWFTYCYFYSMMVISPTSGTKIMNATLFYVLSVLYPVVYCIFAFMYWRLHGHTKNSEIKRRNNAGEW